MSPRPFGILLSFLMVSFAFSDDLAALAKKEKERRAKVTKPVKVFSEGDGKEGSGSAGSVTTLPAPVGASSAESEGGTASSREKEKADWKERAVVARRAVVAAEDAVRATEKQIEAYRADIAPANAVDIQDPMRLQKREARLVEMQTQASKQRVAVVAAKNALSAFEAEARANGVPAGWLR